MKLTLSVGNLRQIKWWVNASYNTHDNCKGQTVVCFSRKQKQNVRSLCKGELVGIDHAMSWIIW
eukprot:CCRYP_002684-RA/>CCRYP_002684-RA protein AED:0.47 eAED:0.47 QI:0/0/0/1/0/0/2/0/63